MRKTKLTIASVISDLVLSGEATIVDGNKFSDAYGNPAKVRNMDSTNDPLEIGDEIYIPADYTVLAVKIGFGSYPCIITEVKSLDGSERFMRFFPNSLARVVIPRDSAGRRMPKVKTAGTVAVWYSQQDTIDNAMKVLAGKTIVVSAKSVYSVRDYDTKEIRHTGIYTYEWKKESDKKHQNSSKIKDKVGHHVDNIEKEPEKIIDSSATQEQRTTKYSQLEDFGVLKSDNDCMKVCKNCNIEYSVSIKFCPECGSKLVTKSNSCPNCGTEYINGQKFCSECGSKIGIYNDKVKEYNNERNNEERLFIGNAKKYYPFVLEGKMGLLSISNDNNAQQIIVPAKYDIIYPFINNYAIVYNGNSYGLIDKSGKETIPVIYLCLNPSNEEGIFFVQEHGRDCYTVDANNKRLNRNGSYDIENELLKAKLSSKLGINEKIFVNKTSNPQIVSYYKDSEIRKYGTPVYCYNTSLEKVICVSTKIKLVNGDKLIVKNEVSGKTGIVDVAGRQLVPAIYDDILYCATTEKYIPENLLEAKKDGKSGYIDFHGNIKIPFVYEYCGTFFNGLAWVSNEKGKIGLIDKTGRIVEPIIHHSIELENDMWIIIDKDMFGEHYSIFGKPKDYVDQNLSHKRFSFNVFHNHNYVGVETSNNKRGVTDLQGKVLIPAIYDDMAFWQTIYKGVIVGKDGYYGVIDIDNNILVPLEYNCLSKVEVIKDEKKVVYYCGKKNGLLGVLDDNFNVCIPFLYSRLDYNKTYNSFVVEMEQKRAMIDMNNNILIPFTTKYINEL